jgi:hypothetical protein
MQYFTNISIASTVAKIGGGSLFLNTVEGVGHRKLIAIIRVGHVKICRNFLNGMQCIKIHIIKIEIKHIRIHV